MARGRPRKYRTKKLSKAAKAQNTKLFATSELAVDCRWYERQKLKRLPQSLGPLERLQQTIMKSMNCGWTKSWEGKLHVVMPCRMY